MTRITYEIVEHDGGWAYRVDGAFSETFPSHDLARRAAELAAREQIVSRSHHRHQVRGQGGSLARRAVGRQ